MDFAAIDVETANSDMASICQIGIAIFNNGLLTDKWSSLVNPEDYFDERNIEIHGITERHTKNAPTILELYPQLATLLTDKIIVSHTNFDRVSLSKSLNKYELPAIQGNWLDSARVARRTWPQCAQRGYGLSPVCKIINHEFNHHDAQEDAIACGQIIIAAINITGISAADWIKRTAQPINPNTTYNSKIQLTGNPEGDLAGETLVFTGELTIPRIEAAEIAAKIGCNVADKVTKKTTLLIVGEQDLKKLKGKEKSRKHLHAEELILKGQNIRILKESDFLALAEINQ